ncbi:MAG: PrsW family intramembrane metalloprotease [Anaerolineales bacterium]|nr:PrsW family intramembrane metalloprotease [Anaerolineales bacterium]
MIVVQLVIALLIATAIPLVALWIIYKRNLYAAGTIESVLYCFVWGALAFVAAYLLHTALVRLAGVNFPTLTRYIAPFSEEILKALILVWLVRQRNFTYFVDGAVYGFAVGIGFAVLENYNYILSRESAALTVAIGRTLSSNLVHAVSSAAVGVTLGLGRFQRARFQRSLYLVGGLLIAAVIHGGYNSMLVMMSSRPGMVFLYAVLAGFSGTGLIMILIQRGLAEERQWIAETLGTFERITSHEARAVDQLAEINVVLTPLIERFGKNKAALIAQCLVVQARLGIYRKTLAKLPEEQMRREAEIRITELLKEMEILRRKIGVYPMMYLRLTFSEKNRSTWDRLENIVSAGPSTGQQGLWGDLQARLEQPPTAEPSQQKDTLWENLAQRATERKKKGP